MDHFGLAQYLVLSFELLEVLLVGCGAAGPHTVFNPIVLDRFVEGLRHAADFGSDRFNSGPQRGVLASTLLNQPNSTFADFRGGFVRLLVLG